MWQKSNIPAHAGHFLRTEIDSTDFENEKLTTKIRRNKAEKPYFFKKIFEKILKQTKPSNKIGTSKNIRQRNKSSKTAKNCWLSGYKRSRWNKTTYMFVYSKKETRKTIFLQLLEIF